MTVSDAQGPPELAGVVLALGAPDSAVAATRSLLAQEPPVEVVVVNSGGGDMAGKLRAAGITVPVIEREERLYVGAVRNLGIDATQARFVGFLAADCLAKPGWSRFRLAAHRSGHAVVASAVVPSRTGSPVAWASHLALYRRRLPGVPRRKAALYGASYDRGLFSRYGRFREDLRTGEDTEFHARLHPSEKPVWKPRVRAVHESPGSFMALMSDQYQRGVRASQRTLEVHGKQIDYGVSWIRRELRSTRRLLRQFPKDSLPRVHRLAWALLPAALAAYAVGGAAANARRARADNGAGRPASSGLSDHPRAGAEPGAPPRLLALLTFHNEARFLEGYLANVAPKVDGIIALDDGSTDGSADLLRGHPAVLELLSNPVSSPHTWDEPANQRRLVEAAARHQPDWLFAVDADERLEREFRVRADREIRAAEAKGFKALCIGLYELWNDPTTYRVDGVWGLKRKACLFRYRTDHAFDPRPLHNHWASLNSQVNGTFRHADLRVYHLRMLRPEDRQERMNRYQNLDPEARWQSFGYEYLCDENGLKLARVEPGRDYMEPDGMK